MTDTAPRVTLSSIYETRESCRSCQGKNLVPVLNLGDQYIAKFEDTADIYLPRAPMLLVRCGGCGLLQLMHTVDPDLMFREYWYRSGINKTMRDEMRDVATQALAFNDEGGAWLDIGANDGTLLSCVPKDFVRVACEPAATFTHQLREHCDVVVPDYFSAAAIKDKGEREFDVITSCAMFYDLDDPASFVQDIAKVLAKNGVWVNQLNDSPTILRNNAFDGICHEHLTYWSVPQLKELYGRFGLKIVKVTANEINGGSVRVFAVHNDRSLDEVRGVFETPSAEDVDLFAHRVVRWKHRMVEILNDEVSRRGPVWGYGASTKAVSMLQYLNQNQVFTAIADRNPAKWGKVMSGTWIRVASEEEFRAAKPHMAVAFIWAFRNEILARERPLMDSGTTMLMPLPNVEFCT